MNIVKWCLAIFTPAMFKTRNTGTGNGMQRTWGIGGGGWGGGRGMLYFAYIAKHSWECPQTVRGILKHPE